MPDVIATGRIPWARWPDFSRYADEVHRLYSAEPESLVWFEGPLVSHAGTTAIGALRTAGDHGLDPLDYDAETLGRVAQYSTRASLSIASVSVKHSVALKRVSYTLHASLNSADSH